MTKQEALQLIEEGSYLDGGMIYMWTKAKGKGKPRLSKVMALMPFSENDADPTSEFFAKAKIQDIQNRKVYTEFLEKVMDYNPKKDYFAKQELKQKIVDFLKECADQGEPKQSSERIAELIKDDVDEEFKNEKELMKYTDQTLLELFYQAKVIKTTISDGEPRYHARVVAQQ